MVLSICTKCGEEFDKTSETHTTCYYCRTRHEPRQLTLKQLKGLAIDLEAALKDPLVQKIIEGYNYKISFRELDEGIIALAKYATDKESIFANPEFLKELLRR